MTQCLPFQKQSRVELFRADRYKCIHGKLRRHISQRCCRPVNSLQENNTQGKSTLAAVGSELKPIISNKSDCLLKQNTKRHSVSNVMMINWIFIHQTISPNYVMPELKPFQCNTTCWGISIEPPATPNVWKLFLGTVLKLFSQHAPLVRAHTVLKNASKMHVALWIVSMAVVVM